MIVAFPGYPHVYFVCTLAFKTASAQDSAIKCMKDIANCFSPLEISIINSKYAGILMFWHVYL